MDDKTLKRLHEEVRDYLTPQQEKDYQILLGLEGKYRDVGLFHWLNLVGPEPLSVVSDLSKLEIVKLLINVKLIFKAHQEQEQKIDRWIEEALRSAGGKEN